MTSTPPPPALARWRRIGDLVVEIGAMPFGGAQLTTFAPRAVRVTRERATPASVRLVWEEGAQADLRFSRRRSARSIDPPGLLRSFLAARVFCGPRQDVLLAADDVLGVSMTSFLERLSQEDGALPVEVACDLALRVGRHARAFLPRIDPGQLRLAWDGSVHARPDFQPREADGLSSFELAWFAPADRFARTMRSADPDNVYRIAAILHSLLAPAYRFRTGQERIAAVEAGARPPLSQFAPDVPRTLARLVDRALSTIRSGRPDRAELVDAMSAHAAAQPAFVSALLAAMFPVERAADMLVAEELPHVMALDVPRFEREEPDLEGRPLLMSIPDASLRELVAAVEVRTLEYPRPGAR